MTLLPQRKLNRIVETAVMEINLRDARQYRLEFDVRAGTAKSEFYVSGEEAAVNDFHVLQWHFKQYGDWNDHKPWIKSTGGTFPCGICGKAARIGFEVEGRPHCVRCFEDDESLHLEGRGFGHSCDDCGSTAKTMFGIKPDSLFLKFYPITEKHPRGGLICLPCFEDKAGGVADYYGNLTEITIWTATFFMHKDIKLLVP